MNLLDIQKLKEEGNSFLADKEVKEEEGCIVISNRIAFMLNTSYSYDRSKDIEIKLPSGISIGKIKFLKGKEIADIFSLSDEEYICFLNEYNKSTIVDSSYKYVNDFLILEENNLKDYLIKYMKTSPIWGSFFHIENQPSIEFNKKASISSLEVIEDIEINNPIYLENLFLSINEPNPINRFLKLYHLLELQFDLHTAVLIRNLLDQGGKEKEISSKLRDYTRDEDDRLESLIKERCKDLVRLVNHLNEITSFSSEAITIFYEYGKTKNPLKRADFNTLTSHADKFSKSKVEQMGYSFASLIPKLATYWIYRIRCCVAHNRFGEYILTVQDEKFVVEFAEPLLKEIIIQCFKK